MAAPNVTVPVVLTVGNTSSEVGTIDLPFTTTNSTAERGTATVSLQPDMPAFMANLAELLHGVANEITNPSAQGETHAERTAQS